VDDASYTEHLDLASITTRSELAEFLRIVHLRADKPSFRSLEARTRHAPTPLSKTVVSEMLRGVRFPRKAVMVSFLQACGLPDDHVALWSHAWERIAAPYSGSPMLDIPESSVVHGLLQTAEYARAGHEGAIPRFSPERIEMQIEAKLIRQTILVRDHPPQFAVVLDEAALRRMVGGRLVMAAQLANILEMSALPNVVVQVLPFEQGAHPGLETNFTVLELPNPAPDVVYIEGLMGAIYLERPDDLERSHEVFSRLQSIALSPEDSVSWISHEQQKITGGSSVPTRSDG
jgi:hypothetical protein